MDNYNNLRRIKVILIADKLYANDKFKKISYDKQMKIIECIENSCLNESLRKSKEYNIICIWTNAHFINVYHSICYNIVANIDVNSEIKSDYLINKIINNEIDINTIANLTGKELCPEKYKTISKKINERFNTEQVIKYSELFFCKKCKRNQTTTERVQNRSNDEGSSFHVTCLFCNNKWFK
jgi:DNA-directed RNA polymerase subunit M/transcription elongation factor TFIIS